MRAARVEKLISAIDIGSSKVSALIAGVTDSGELLVLGTGQRESRGVTHAAVLRMSNKPNCLCAMPLNRPSGLPG